MLFLTRRSKVDGFRLLSRFIRSSWFSFLWLLLVVWLVTSRGARPSSITLKVAFISDPIPDFHENSWMLELVLASFFDAFGLPDERIHLELAVFVPCGRSPKHQPTLLSHSDVEVTHEVFATEVRNVVNRTRGKVHAIEYYCGGLFQSAICHFSSAQQSSKNVIYFFLEHDWLLFPSRVGTDAHTLASYLLSNQEIQYVVLQRGDRSIESDKILKAFPSANLHRTKQYSNNPFMATHEFVQGLGRGPDVCSNGPVKSWERTAEEYLSQDKLNRQLSLLIPTESVVKPNLYHIDGRLVSFARLFHIGPLFNMSHLNMQSWNASQAFRPAAMIRNAELFCEEQPQECGPYYLRERFLSELERYIPINPCTEDMSWTGLAREFLKAHQIKDQSFDEVLDSTYHGHFPFAARTRVVRAIREHCQRNTSRAKELRTRATPM